MKERMLREELGSDVPTVWPALLTPFAALSKSPGRV